MIQGLMFDPTIYELFERMTLESKIERAIDLLLDNAPEDGYYLAFSGGKDSIVAHKLLDLAGVKFQAVYHVTTIDPPELIYFIREHYPNVIWDYPKQGNMLHQIAVSVHLPPTRQHRWCCNEYKERGGEGRIKVFGVRKQESNARRKRWDETLIDTSGDKCICPIAYWTEDDVWNFIRSNNMPYCSLYDEGFKRLGCVGCPLTSIENQDREFNRWPKFESNWKKAIIDHWNIYKNKISSKTGKLRYEGRFKTGEDFWRWWREAKAPDYMRGSCQMELLWTNEPGIYDGEDIP